MPLFPYLLAAAGLQIGYYHHAFGGQIRVRAEGGARHLPYVALEGGLSEQYNPRPWEAGWRHGIDGSIEAGWPLQFPAGWVGGPRAEINLTRFLPNASLDGYSAAALGLEIGHASSFSSVRRWSLSMTYEFGSYENCDCGWMAPRLDAEVRFQSGWVIDANLSPLRLSAGVRREFGRRPE